MKKLFSDRKVCTGCRSCEVICSFTHLNGESNPKKARIRVRQDLLQGQSEPIVCRQCNKPKCIPACPEDALHQDASLKVPVINQTRCNLCLACVKACSFGAIFYDKTDEALLFCDLCGGDPMCVKFCRMYPHKTHAALSYMEPREYSRMNRQSAAKE